MARQHDRQLDGKHDRREFLHRSVASAVAPVAFGVADDLGSEPTRSQESGRDDTSRPTIQFPRLFTGRQLDMIAFPLGGIGAGSISLGGRGELRDWEIFNRPARRDCMRLDHSKRMGQLPDASRRGRPAPRGPAWSPRVADVAHSRIQDRSARRASNDRR